MSCILYSRRHFVHRRFVGYIIRIFCMFCNRLTSQKTNENPSSFPVFFVFIHSIFNHILRFIEFIAYFLIFSPIIFCFYLFCSSCSQRNFCSQTMPSMSQDCPVSFPEHFFTYFARLSPAICWVPVILLQIFKQFSPVLHFLLPCPFALPFYLLCKLHIYNILQCFLKKFS